MEQNRLWHEPVVEIYANAISPGISCSAKAYDLANRRWYELNVSDAAPTSDDKDSGRSTLRTFQVPGDDWLSSTVTKHVSDCYKSTGSPPSWSVITTTSIGQPVIFEPVFENHCLLGIPFSERFHYGHKSSDQLPTINFQDLRNKTYLSRGVDYCDWEGRKCVFKRIEFDCDNESHESEIRAREHLIQHINQESITTFSDINNEMMRRFNVIPILGVVLHDETSWWMTQTSTVYEDEDRFEQEAAVPVALELQEASTTEPGGIDQQSPIVAGFITPYMGRSLELVGSTQTSTGAESDGILLPSMPALGSGSLGTTADMPITIEQLLDLVKGVRELSRCGVTHGDICYWNIVLEKAPKPSSPSTVPRLLLIDMGDTAPDYDNDAVAMADVLLWCLKHSPSVHEGIASRNKVIIAAALLKEVDFDGAIGVLSLSTASEDAHKTRSSVTCDVPQPKRRRL